jgi:hypothetical protein
MQNFCKKYLPGRTKEAYDSFEYRLSGKNSPLLSLEGFAAFSCSTFI